MPPALNLTLTWRKPDPMLERWYVYGPPPTDACGGVWREKGMWRAEVWPRGRRILGAYYRNRPHAMRHIERWLRAHPEVIGAALDPRGMKGRIARRPNRLLEEFVRTHPPFEAALRSPDGRRW